MSFSSLGLSQQLISTINELDYIEPTPIQSEAIPHILAGHDIMARAQTGTGKTAAFALPLLHLISKHQIKEHPIKQKQTQEQPTSDQLGISNQLISDKPQTSTLTTLVLTPTRELAQQVHGSFIKYGKHTELSTALAYGGVSINPQINALKNGTNILVATPGRLLDLLYKKVINLSQVKHIVFDEADRMLDMGFIPDINRILKALPLERQTLLFSATFDDAIFKLSKTLLSKPKLIEIDEKNTAATQVEQMVYAVDEDRKRELTSYLIGSKNWQQVLIFTRTKQGADALAKEMCKDGIKTQTIHGDKSQGARERALADFKDNKVRALVATDVAARGLDIEQLKYVINYELPYIAEDYIHRIGRTGRAGNKGLAISLLSIGEEYLLEEVEAVLDTRLPQQWLPGYEPDLTKEAPTSKKNSRTTQNKRRKDRAYGKNKKNRQR